MTLPFVSVIIPVRDDPNRLRLALQALSRQSYPRCRCEVIVVDNGSTAEVNAVVAEFPWVLFAAERAGASYQARNTGLRLARGDVFAFTDADCIPAANWIEAGVRALAESPRIGLVAGDILMFPMTGDTPSACELYDMACSFRPQEFLQRYRYGVTANLFTTRAVMDRVGAFDARLVSGGDCEWGYRVYRAGFEQVYCPAATVRHPARSTLAGLVRKSLRVTIGTMHTLEKHNPEGRTFLQYVYHQAVERPVQLWKDLGEGPCDASWPVRWKVILLYYLIKSLQMAERLRFKLWGRR